MQIGVLDFPTAEPRSLSPTTFSARAEPVRPPARTCSSNATSIHCSACPPVFSTPKASKPTCCSLRTSQLRKNFCRSLCVAVPCVRVRIVSQCAHRFFYLGPGSFSLVELASSESHLCVSGRGYRWLSSSVPSFALPFFSNS